MSFIAFILAITTLSAVFRFQAIGALVDASLSASASTGSTPDEVSVEDSLFGEDFNEGAILAGEYIPAVSGELEHQQPVIGDLDRRELTHWL